VSDSGQKFIKRNRAPRVHITYEDPYDADILVELPFVMGVMADLSGNNAGSEKPEMAQRDFVDFDVDNFDARMGGTLDADGNRTGGIQPGMKFNVANTLSGDDSAKLSVDLKFNKMDDFKPAQVARQVPALAKLLEAREQLKNLQLYMDGKTDAEAKLRELLNDPALMEALRERMNKSEPES